MLLDFFPFFIFLFFFLVVLFFLLILFSQLFPFVLFKEGKITIKTKKRKISLNCWIADNIISRHIGAMFRKNIPDDFCMLFVFPDSKKRSLWMFNVKFPLEACFISDDKRILEIVSMEPCLKLPCPKYESAYKSKYVLEVRQGLARENDICIGDRVTFN